MRLLLDIVQDPVRLQELMAEIDRSTEQHGATAQAAAFMTLLKGLAEYLSKTEPQRLDALFGHMGRAAGQLSAEAMLKLLDQRNRPEAMVGSINVPGAVMERMTDESVSHFVAASVIKERGATERLAHGLPGAGARHATASGSCWGWPSGRSRPAKVRPEGFAELWQRVEGMLTSYSDEKYVSEQYARELSGARDPRRRRRARQRRSARAHRGLAGDGRRCGAAQARSPAAARSARASRRSPHAGATSPRPPTAHAEDLVRVGYFDQAWQLADAVVREGQRDPERTAYALDRARALRPRHA